MTNTDELLRQEFEAWSSGRDLVGAYSPWSAYQACNAKHQEEMARDKALLRECAKELRDIHIHSKEPFTSHEWLFYAHDVSGKILEKLKQQGYDND